MADCMQPGPPPIPAARAKKITEPLPHTKDHMDDKVRILEKQLQDSQIREEMLRRKAEELQRLVETRTEDYKRRIKDLQAQVENLEKKCFDIPETS